MAKAANQSLKEAIKNLETARDEARLGLHLLSMEGKKRWDELETKIDALGADLSDRAETLSEKSAEKAVELSRLVRDFVETHVRKTVSTRH